MLQTDHFTSAVVARGEIVGSGGVAAGWRRGGCSDRARKQQQQQYLHGWCQGVHVDSEPEGLPQGWYSSSFVYSLLLLPHLCGYREPAN